VIYANIEIKILQGRKIEISSSRRSSKKSSQKR
jgi:hypothetical protein